MLKQTFSLRKGFCLRREHIIYIRARMRKALVQQKPKLQRNSGISLRNLRKLPQKC